MLSPIVGSQGGAVSYERGTPVPDFRDVSTPGSQPTESEWHPGCPDIRPMLATRDLQSLLSGQDQSRNTPRAG